MTSTDDHPTDDADSNAESLNESEQTEPATEQAIRVGSPFAVDPEPLSGRAISERTVAVESLYDVGPLRYTAMGATFAAVMVLGFASAAWWWFPGGGALIAMLGCALAFFGLFSPRRNIAGICLLLHLGIFVACYSRAIDV